MLVAGTAASTVDGPLVVPAGQSTAGQSTVGTCAETAGDVASDDTCLTIDGNRRRAPGPVRDEKTQAVHLPDGAAVFFPPPSGARGSAVVQDVPMVSIDEHGRPEPPIAADEVATLLGFLDFQRATLEWKTRGLDAAGLRATIRPTTMTLGGILSHLSWVEEYWFTWVLLQRRPASPWDTVDWEHDQDADWHRATELDPESLRAAWQDAVARSRASATEALADGGLDRQAALAPDDPPPSLRWIVVHMIEEYARHNGHADLLREAVDGETGE